MAPRKPAKVSAKTTGIARPATRARLIAAADALIWGNSYAHVSVEDICCAAGVQKGSFYHFFPTKHDLAAAALEAHWAQNKARLDEIFSDTRHPKRQLQSLCREVLEKQQESRNTNGWVCGCPYATVGAEMSGFDEGLRALTEEISGHFSGYFERLLKNAAKRGLIPATGIKARAEEMHIYLLGAMLKARMTNSLDSVGKPLEVALTRIAGL